MKNVSNPAALGIETVVPDSNTVVQFVVARGTRTVRMGMKGPNGWSTTDVVEPERFGPIPTTFTGLVAWVKAFQSAFAETA